MASIWLLQTLRKSWKNNLIFYLWRNKMGSSSVGKAHVIKSGETQSCGSNTYICSLILQFSCIFLQKLARFNSDFLKFYNFANFCQVGLYIIKISKLERSFWIYCHYWEHLRTFLGACRKWPFYYYNCMIIALVIAY